MSQVTNVLAANNPILASELNTNFNDLLALVGQVGADQLAGGITQDKLTDRFTHTWFPIEIVPHADAGGTIIQPLGTAGTLWSVTNASGTEQVTKKFQLPMQSNSLCYLTAILTHVVQYDATDSPYVSYYINDTVQIGRANINIDGNDKAWLTANPDPLTNPLMPLSNGDFITIRTGRHAGSIAAKCRGLTVFFGIKHVLIP